MNRPNDERHFIHGRVIGAIGGFIGGGPAGAIGGFIGGRRPGATTMSFEIPGFPSSGGGGTSAGTIALRAAQAGLAALGLPPKGGETLGTYLQRNVPRNLWDQVRNLFGLGVGPSGNGPGPVKCDPPFVDEGQGFCVFPGSPAGGMGELRKGRYGPAEEPFFETRNIRSCLSGFVLGDDKLCYKKGTITNAQRLWPKGTAPLLTGGQMRAIRIAAGAGRKLERTTKRLQKIGLMKKPAPRARIAAHEHAREARGVVNV